jgi:CRP-like cAMP-binding protein
MSGEFLLRKLQAYGPLSAVSQAAIIELGKNRLRSVRARQDIIREGDDPKDVYLITEGWAYRYKMLEGGERQIIGLFVPGDLCDLHVYILKEMDHSIGAITPLTYAKISPAMLDEIGDGHPRVIRALWWETLVNASIQREWTVNLGQRDAYQSLAHLCCEMFLRLRSIGLVQNTVCAFPLTHQDIADSLGLTQTHVGRVVRKLNDSGHATLHRRELVVHDLPKLQATALFNPNYLHQNQDV